MKSISKIVGGGTPNTAVKEYWDGCINWFTPTEIGENKYVSESIRKLTDSGFKNSSAKMIEPYSILMTSRASIGLVSINMTSCCTNQGFQSIIPTDIELDYLYYLILTNKFQHELIRRSTKSTFLEISHSEISKITVSLPSNKSEQKKVASLLNKIDEKIDVLINKISTLKKYKEGLMTHLFESIKNPLIKLKNLELSNDIELGRGNIIAKQTGIYPVYSSSAKNNGLFCYSNDYMFDEELVTWSIDGGGEPFKRNRHKFSVTNVCGYIKIKDFSKWNYGWLYINIWNNWKMQKFDYSNKAHPSVIKSLYSCKRLDIMTQNKIDLLISKIDKLIEVCIDKQNRLLKLKTYLLNSLFI